MWFSNVILMIIKYIKNSKHLKIKKRHELKPVSIGITLARAVTYQDVNIFQIYNAKEQNIMTCVVIHTVLHVL